MIWFFKYINIGTKRLNESSHHVKEESSHEEDESSRRGLGKNVCKTCIWQGTITRIYKEISTIK